MLRIALVGCGEHSCECHAPSLSRHASERPSEIKLVAACDLNLSRAQAVCKEFGFAKPYADYHELLEKEKPDAVVLIMPPTMIASTGIELLQRRIPCVIEKPLGRNLEESRRLLQTAQETGTVHMVSMNRRFSPLLNKAKKWAASIGPLRFIKGTMLRIQRAEARFPWGTGMHLVDALRHLDPAGGIPQELNIMKMDQPPHAPWCQASFRFQSGLTGALEILPTAGVADEIYELFGESYRARFATQYNGAATLTCWHAGKIVLQESTDPKLPIFLRGEYEETAEFLAALREKRAPYPSLAQVIPSSEMCAALTGEA